MAKKRKGGVVVKRDELPRKVDPYAPVTPAPQQEEAAPEAVPDVTTPLPQGSEPLSKQGKNKKRRKTASSLAEGSPLPEASPSPEASEPEEPVDGAVKGGVVTGCSSSAPPPPPIFGAGVAADHEATLEWLLWPLSPAVFFSEYWEKKPLHLKRNRPDFYAGLLSKGDLDRYIRDSRLQYGQRINLQRFDETKQCKVTVNKGAAGSPASSDDVAKSWKEGTSIQAMHPQQYHESVWRLLAALERPFGSLWGANAYLSPAKSHSFAPYFDDVEVFMMQLEGSKRWKLHIPPAGQEYPLPVNCSEDFDVADLRDLLLDCTVSPGDLLYIPRGVTYHGEVWGDSFSHHLSASTYQATAWPQVMLKAISGALDRALDNSSEFRAGLPINFLSYMGSWHDSTPDEDEDTSNSGSAATSFGTSLSSKRAAFTRRFQGLLKRLHEFVDLDEICDELGVDFMGQRMPPPPSGADLPEGALQLKITQDTEMKWVDPSTVRFILSEDPETSEMTVMLFHSLQNGRDLHMNVATEDDVGCLRFEAATYLPALRKLHHAGSEFVRCGDLPLDGEEDCIELCENLKEAGLVELRNPEVVCAARPVPNESNCIRLL